MFARWSKSKRHAGGRCTRPYASSVRHGCVRKPTLAEPKAEPDGEKEVATPFDVELSARARTSDPARPLGLHLQLVTHSSSGAVGSLYLEDTPSPKARDAGLGSLVVAQILGFKLRASSLCLLDRQNAAWLGSRLPSCSPCGGRRAWRRGKEGHPGRAWHRRGRAPRLEADRRR